MKKQSTGTDEKQSDPTEGDDSQKLNDNKKRDKRNYNSLKSIGWNVLIIWECEIKNTRFIEKVNNFLN